MQLRSSIWWVMQTSTHTNNRLRSLRGGIVSEWASLVLKVVPIAPTLTPKPFLIYVPPFVGATNSALNRIIITEEITHIKPLRCHLPGNLGRLLPKKAWRDIRCMGNEICINSVAPSLIYFCLFTRTAKGKIRDKKWRPSEFLRVHRAGVITAIGAHSLTAPPQ